MKIEINIDDYLSEVEKKELAKEYFLNSLEKGLEDRHSHKANYENYERIIANSVYEFLDRKIDSILSESHENMIKKQVDRILGEKGSYEYRLFRVKSAWEKENSTAQNILNEAVELHREVMTKKIHDKLDEVVSSLDDDNLFEMYTDAFNNFISDKLSNNQAKN